MIINKHTIKGVKGQTVIYSFNVIENNGNIVIKNLHFESPIGFLDIDEDFVIDLTREEIDKIINVKVFVDNREYPIEIEEIYIGAERDEVEVIGLEGDIVLSIYIPADETQEIIIDYKEVIDDNKN